ncbi:hypothetical protein Tco_1155617 [Tanacetum coccineum]
MCVEFLATPSELASDDVKPFVTALECNRPNEALEDLAKRWRQGYKATPSRLFNSLRIDLRFGIRSGIRACALRKFDLEDMEFKSAQSNTTAKLPLLKLGEYEMWEMRIKQYFQVQDYALWEVIKNDNSWVSVPQTSQENGTIVTKNLVPVTAEEKINKKNDVKARSLLLMALPSEHLLTFSQYNDAKTLYAAIKTRFRGNEATKKTQKALLKQQYENFNASSSESLDSIFNRLQKIVSRLTILGVVITPEDLNSNIDDLYNNFKIVEQEVKKSIGASTGTQNMAFMTAPSTSSTSNVNTANSDVSTVSTNVNTTSSKDSTAILSDATIYDFLANQPNGSQLVHEDLEQIHDDDLEEMDLKWQLALLIVMEYLVNISKRRAFWSLNKDILKITILKTNTPYPLSGCIHVSTHQRPQRSKAQYDVSKETQYTIFKK